MQEQGYFIFRKRNKYRQRRNLIRKVFLLFCSIIVAILIYKFYLISSKFTPIVEIHGNILINKDKLIQKIEELIKHKSFFSVNPRRISTDLKKTIPIFSDVVVRKYIFPESKILVFVKERNIWAKLVTGENKNSEQLVVVSDSGNIISASLLSSIPLKLIPIYSYVNFKQLDSESTLAQLKKIFDLLRDDFKISVSRFCITNSDELEIYPYDKFKIRAGKIDDDLISRIFKLKPIMEAINERAYVVEYVDLTLDKGAVFKKHLKTKKEFRLFRGKK